MSDTVTFTDTEIVLTEMLTENTGVDLLDSGGAYGRHWEKNQGATVEGFVNGPKAILGRYGVTFSVFHYLNSHLEYNPIVDKIFQDWMNEPVRKEESYFSCVYEWTELQDNDDYHGSFLTYNNESNCLSQDFQADVFQYDGVTYCCLSIHGGCDIRGGYTRPRVFEILTESFGFDTGDYSLFTVDRKADDVCLDIRYGEMTDRDGCYIGREDSLYNWANFWEEAEGCPIWDEDNDRWIAPDGDGYLDIEPDFLWNS
jgi:hypothetical protein